MKFTLTGSLGHTNKPLAESLISAGHEVTVISSNPERAKDIEALGAKAAIGSVEDADFLIKAFTGAEGVYTMVPPKFHSNNYRLYLGETGKKYAAAIRATGVKKVVNLSSIGADLENGTGPIAGLYDVEQIFNAIDNVAITHLRAGFFYLNFFGNIGMIKNANIIGANYPDGGPLIMVHPKDIASVAAEEIQKNLNGKSVKYVVSDERTTTEVASILGKAIGKPDLKWVEFTDEQSLAGMIQAGFQKNIAEMYVEMGSAVRSKILWKHYKSANATPIGKTKVEDFAKEFAAVYNAS